MKKIKFIFGIAIVFFIFVFSGCKEKYEFSVVKDFRSDISQIAFSSDGRYIARGYFTLKIFDSSSDTVLIKEFNDYSEVINEITFSPDNKFLITATDSLIRIYSVSQDFSFLKSISGEGFSVSADSKYIAVMQENKVEIYNLDNEFSVFKELSFSDKITGVKFDKSGSYFVVTEEHKLYVYDLPDWNNPRTKDFGEKIIGTFDISPDGKSLALTRYNEIYIYSLENKISLKHRISGFLSYIHRLKYSSDGKFLFVKSNKLSIFSIENDKYILTAFLKGDIRDLEFSKNEFVVTYADKIQYYSFNFDENNEKFELYYENYFMLDEPDWENFPNIAFNRQSQMLFLSEGGNLNIFAYYHSRFNYKYSIEEINDFDYFKTKTYLAVIKSTTHEIQIYKLGYTPKLVASIPYEGASDVDYPTIKITNDDHYMIVEDEHSKFIYDISDLNNITLIKKFDLALTTYISPDTKYFIVGNDVYCFDNLDSVCFNLDTLNSFYRFFSPDGHYLVVIKDSVIKFFDRTDSFKLKKVFEGYTNVVFTEDGKYFAAYNYKRARNIDIYSLNNLNTPKKTFHFDNDIEDVFASRYILFSPA